MNSAVIHPSHIKANIHADRPKLFTAKRFVETKT